MSLRAGNMQQISGWALRCGIRSPHRASQQASVARQWGWMLPAMLMLAMPVSAAISAPDLQTATMSFSGIGGQSPYKFVSDPNISYVMLDGADVRIGLAGFLNAQAALQAILGPGIVVPANAYASEVVSVEYAGVSRYLYSFAQPTVSGVTAGDPNGSYTGNYEVSFKVPEPAALALASLGLAGIAGFALRGRRKP